jgi:hypothetical protein
MMPYRQDLHCKLGAFGDGAASGRSKNRLQAIEVEHTAPSDCKVNR